MIILDPELNSDGLMRIEPYLYGIKKPNRRIFEITSKGEKDLFNTYYYSYESMWKSAIEIQLFFLDFNNSLHLFPLLILIPEFSLLQLCMKLKGIKDELKFLFPESKGVLKSKGTLSFSVRHDKDIMSKKGTKM